ncbi:hypothetical protein VIRA109638_09370 [Vibrio rarus]
MNTLNKASTLMAMLMLTACGGGSGGNSDSSTDSAVIEETPVQDPIATPSPTEEPSIETAAQEIHTPQRSMQDLSIPNDFNYDPMQSLTVHIDISNFSRKRAYISLYSDYALNTDGTWQPNYAYRIANGALNNGQGNIEVSYAEQYRSILAEIWFYDGTEPIQKIISTTEDQIRY